ncbi:MAG: hypothetical protein AB7H92_18660, partial [Microbacteriaceae bacterium]
MTAAPTVGDLLAWLRPDVKRVYITGAPMGGAGIVALREWAREVREPWAPDGDQYVALAQPRLTYRNQLTGRTVTVLRAGPWFGESASPAVCAAAWTALEEALSVS